MGHMPIYWYKESKGLAVLIDSHCHLNFPALSKEASDVVARAGAAGVAHMVNIGTTRRDFIPVRDMAAQFPNVSCSFGIHPDHVHEEGESLGVDEIIDHATHPKVVGIGETGLDYFHKDAPVDVQKRSFRDHLRAARVLNLPVIVHSRQAEEDTAEILREIAAEEGEHPLTGVLHCFSSRRILAEEALKLGFYVSLSGILTFKKSEELRSIVKDVPLDRLLVETDAPFLSPEPLRGKICEPAYVVHTARVLADVKGVSFDEICSQTTENFFSLFTKVTKSIPSRLREG
jgi:TatD DNase family protein